MTAAEGRIADTRLAQRMRLLERAFAALAALGRQEYSDAHSLAEIAEVWGDVTPRANRCTRILKRVWSGSSELRLRCMY